MDRVNAGIARRLAVQSGGIDLAGQGQRSAFGYRPITVTVEITESCTMGDPERAIRILQMLKSAGVTLSVDDFGTGYSPLSYLHRFPIDKLKIDRSFVTDLRSNLESQKIVAAILAPGQKPWYSDSRRRR
ncbi:EAL domain-containing protein [Acidisoma silvae]|uniref:EAL domain-containing protein n=1 Tax=Acidisoma silvae TaxID=2802396 RepID=UPI00222181BB|nr:EAL domain-containing protein [Acidisoma silvae]